jgi:hypothetical protein
VTVDLRTRSDGPRALVDAETFFGTDLPPAIEANAGLILPGVAFIDPRPATFAVDDAEWTLAYENERVRVMPGGTERAAHVRLTQQQLTDLVHDQTTFMGLWAANAVDQSRGTVGHLLNWWLVWRAALDGTPIYTPGSVDLAGVDLTRSFHADDDPAEMHAFLETAGFLHLEAVFTPDEMAEVGADMDRAAPSYHEGDGRSWWARTADGDSRVVRMQGFDTHSATTHEILDDRRFLTLAEIPNAGHRFGTKRAENRIEALFKPIGVTEGISDIPWHKDCGLGRHSYDCCGMTVGISVTGADATSGQLRVRAGSHRALIWSGVLQPNLDLPDVPLPTNTGDVTIHLSCTMHMAQPPTERERRVMYSGFGLPPRTDDTSAIAEARTRLGAVRESAPLTVLDRHFKS